MEIQNHGVLKSNTDLTKAQKSSHIIQRITSMRHTLIEQFILTAALPKSINSLKPA